MVATIIPQLNEMGVGTLLMMQKLRRYNLGGKHRKNKHTYCFMKKFDIFLYF